LKFAISRRSTSSVAALKGRCEASRLPPFRRHNRPRSATSANKSNRRVGASFHFDRDLGLNSSGQKILGACYFKPKFAIFVDPSLSRDSERARFRFTLAHELGHLSLHRNLRLDFQSLDATNRAIFDGEGELGRGPRVLTTPRDFLEWQANSYAAALLMPRLTFGPELLRQQRDMGITRRPQRIYLNDHPHSAADLREMVRRLGCVYQTSNTAIRIRLQELDLIRDLRSSSSDHLDGLVSMPKALSTAVADLLSKWKSPSADEESRSRD
jgi:hypothetical protein